MEHEPKYNSDIDFYEWLETLSPESRAEIKAKGLSREQILLLSPQELEEMGLDKNQIRFLKRSIRRSDRGVPKDIEKNKATFSRKRTGSRKPDKEKKLNGSAESPKECGFKFEFKEKKSYREFSSCDSSIDDIAPIIADCIRLNTEIRAIWKSVEVQEDIAEFLYVNMIVEGELTSWKENSSIPLNVDQWRQFEGLLKLFKEKISFDLSKVLASLRRKRALVYYNNRVYEECKRMMGINVAHDLQSPHKDLLKFITCDDGKQMWETEFGHQSMMIVTWASFIQALSKYVDEDVKKEDEELLRRIILSFGTELVYPKAFGDFLRAFGCLKDCLKNAKHLCSQKWFHGFVSAEEAKRLLSDRPKGTYLMRFSRSYTNSFVLEYVLEEGNIQTVLIHSDMPKCVSVNEANGKLREFANLEELLKHYGDLLVIPFTSDFGNQPWFYGECEIDEARELLQFKPPGTFLIHFHPTLLGAFLCSFNTKEGEYAYVEIRKVPNGYTFVPYSEDGKSPVRTPEQTPIFSDIGSFIRSHGSLKYNYSETNVPDLECEPFMPNDGETVIDFQLPSNGVTSSERKSIVYCETLATYPRGSGGHKILCDALHVWISGNRSLVSVADGCGWFGRAQRAAEIASKGSIEYLTKSSIQDSITSAEICRTELLKCFDHAHRQIVEQQGVLTLNGTYNTSSCGTTTLIVGMLLKVRGAFVSEEWAFICASVGDCKAFHWNSKTGKVTDVTFGNRKNVRDAKDCGGRLGPWICERDPDYRNRATYYWPCMAGDCIMLVSDGIHDNLDPEHLGLMPRELTLRQYDYASWDDMPGHIIEIAKSEYACCLLERCISQCKQITPKLISRALIQHTVDITRKSRDFMEANPTLSEPESFKEYPGKMDHATCVCLSVGDRHSWFEQHTKDKKKKPTFFFVNRKPSSASEYNKPLILRTETERDNPFMLKEIELVSPLQEICVSPFGERTEVQRFQIGRSDSQKVECSSHVAGWSCSTFPIIEKDNQSRQLKEPITSFFAMDLSINRHTCVLTVGCNYGQKAMESSLTACTAFLTEIELSQIKIGNSKQAAVRLIRAMNAAHQAIIKTSDVLTDTEVQMFCGIACRLPNLQNTQQGDWLFICANLGNNKAFCWSHKLKKLKEITVGNENLEPNGKNIGGKIGISLDGNPDLSNLRVHYQYCDDEEKDIIVIMSPLVYYNVDPEVMGMSTKAILDQAPPVGNLKKKDKNVPWSKISPEQRATVRLKALEKILQRAPQEDAATFVEELVQHTLTVTKRRREFLKEFLDMEKQMEEYSFSKMPGKMGHATCAAFRVGQLIVPSILGKNEFGTGREDLRASVFYPMRPVEKRE